MPYSNNEKSTRYKEVYDASSDSTRVLSPGVLGSKAWHFMILHTKDLGERAADIADREANEVWEKTHDWNEMYSTWKRVYHDSLMELMEVV